MRLDLTDFNFVKTDGNKKGLVGFAYFTLNGFRFNSVAVFERPTGGYRISYPEKFTHGNRPLTCVYPTKKELADSIEMAITEKLNSEVTNAKENFNT